MTNSLALNFAALTLREATLADAPALAALVNSAYRGESSKRGWTTEADLLGGQRTNAELLTTEMAERHFLMAFQDGDQLVGCVSLSRGNESCHLGMLTVEPGLQAAGLGKQLVRAAEQRARDWGYAVMTLTVIDSRKELIAWYERQGYSATEKTEPFPYGDERFGLPKVEGLRFRMFRKNLALSETPARLPSEAPAHS